MTTTDAITAVLLKLQYSRPTLREYLRRMCEAQFKHAMAWREAGSVENYNYRLGMVYAYRDIERKLEECGFQEETK